VRDVSSSGIRKPCIIHRLLLAYRKAKIVNKEAEISTAASAVRNAEDKAFAKEFYHSLVDQLKGLVEEKKTLQADRRDWQQLLRGGQVLALSC